MPSTVIPCKDCQKEIDQLKATGAAENITCTPLPEDVNKPEEQQRCTLSWEVKI